MFTLMICVLLQANPQKPNTQATHPVTENDSFIRKFDRRFEGLQVIHCTYTSQFIPSDYYTKLRSDDAKASFKNTQKRLTAFRSIEWDETAEGLFRVVITKTTETGTPINRIIYSWDGKDYWKLQYDRLTGRIILPQVTINQNMIELFQTANLLRRNLGINLHPQDQSRSPSYGKRILDAASYEFTPGLVRHGKRCQEIKWYSKNEENKRRETIWVLDSNNPQVVEYLEEFYDMASNYWWKSSSWKIEDADFPLPKVEFGGKSFQIPTKIVKTVYDSKGNLYWTENVLVREFLVNQSVDRLIFTPKIEEGTNVFNFKTGKTIVYGNGPSPRIRALLKQQVEESRTVLRQTGEVDTSSVAPPTTTRQILLWTVGAAGVVGLAVFCIRSMTRAFYSRGSTNRGV